MAVVVLISYFLACSGTEYLESVGKNQEFLGALMGLIPLPQPPTPPLAALSWAMNANGKNDFMPDTSWWLHAH